LNTASAPASAAPTLKFVSKVPASLLAGRGQLSIASTLQKSIRTTTNTTQKPYRVLEVTQRDPNTRQRPLPGTVTFDGRVQDPTLNLSTPATDKLTVVYNTIPATLPQLPTTNIALPPSAGPTPPSGSLGPS